MQPAEGVQRGRGRKEIGQRGHRHGEEAAVVRMAAEEPLGDTVRQRFAELTEQCHRRGRRWRQPHRHVGLIRESAVLGLQPEHAADDRGRVRQFATEILIGPEREEAAVGRSRRRTRFLRIAAIGTPKIFDPLQNGIDGKGRAVFDGHPGPAAAQAREVDEVEFRTVAEGL